MSSVKDSSHQTADADIQKTLGIEVTRGHHSHYLKWIASGVLILLIVLFGLQWFSEGKSQAQRFKTVEANRGDLTVTVTATGTLDPVNQVQVGSEISGTIRTVMVDVNDQVSASQTLAVMDTEQLQAKVSQALASLEVSKAQVKQAEATVVETRNKLRRSEHLAKSGLCSEENCDAARAAYGRASADLVGSKAKVVQAEAFLHAERTTLAKATIHSPVQGIVLKRDVEPGQTVAASFQTPVLFLLAEDLTQMELHVDVDEADVGQVKEGQRATFTVDAYPDQTFPALITEVHFASQTVDGVVTYETVLKVDNTDLLLRPGMTATADITVKQVKNSLLVPNTALRFTPKNSQDQVSGGGGLIGSLLPRPPNASKAREGGSGDKDSQQVWKLENGQPRLVTVRVESTDGIQSAVSSTDLKAGMQLIVDTLEAE